MRDRIIEHLKKQPGGHTSTCLAHLLFSEPAKEGRRSKGLCEHICWSRAVDQRRHEDVRAVLAQLKENGLVEQYGAYYFVKGRA